MDTNDPKISALREFFERAAEIFTDCTVHYLKNLSEELEAFSEEFLQCKKEDATHTKPSVKNPPGVRDPEESTPVPSESIPINNESQAPVDQEKPYGQSGNLSLESCLALQLNEKILALPVGQVEKLSKEGISTIGDFARWVAAECLPAVKSVGEGAVTKFKNRLDAFLQDNGKSFDAAMNAACLAVPESSGSTDQPAEKKPAEDLSSANAYGMGKPTEYYRNSGGNPYNPDSERDLYKACEAGDRTYGSAKKLENENPYSSETEAPEHEAFAKGWKIAYDREYAHVYELGRRSTVEGDTVYGNKNTYAATDPRHLAWASGQHFGFAEVAGMKAYKAGKPIEANPYKIDQEAIFYCAWEKVWKAADAAKTPRTEEPSPVATKDKKKDLDLSETSKRQGRESFTAGEARDSNPFSKDTKPWHGWNAGWDEAFVAKGGPVSTLQVPVKEPAPVTQPVSLPGQKELLPVGAGTEEGFDPDF